MVQGCNPEGSNRVCQACFKPSRASWSSTSGCTYDCNPGSYLDANGPITVTRLHPNSLQRYAVGSISGDGKDIFLGHGPNGGALKKVDENGMLSEYYSSTETWMDARANHNGSKVMAISKSYSAGINVYTLRSLKNGIQQDSHFYKTSNGPTGHIAVGTSIDGQHLYYYLQGKVYYSSNAMASSTEVAVSSNHVYGICVSSDGKVAWTMTYTVAQEVSPSGTGSKSKTISSPNSFVAIACSADVSTIVLTTQTNVIYTSSDGGLSFVATGKDLQFDKTNPISFPSQSFQSNFSNCGTGNVCDGWDCAGATLCGLVTDPTPGFGSICGGYGKTGKGRYIERQINYLDKWATYTFSVDVIIGDSWDGEYLIIEVAPVLGGYAGTWERCYEKRYNMKWNSWNDKPNHKTGRNICKYNTIFLPLMLPLLSHIQIYQFLYSRFPN